MKKALALISIVVLLAMTASICGATPTLSVTPNDSNIFKVNGSGFAPNESVVMKLMIGNVSFYVFPSLSANSLGQVNET